MTRTTLEIEAAFRRGELTPEEAQAALNQWDESRVRREVAELIAIGQQPSGNYPAALWEFYWATRLAGIRSELFGLGYKAAPDIEPQSRRSAVVTPSMVRAHLLARGWPDSTRVYLEGGSFSVGVPFEPGLFKFGISLRKVAD
jgi:hypothetical protein